MGGGERRSKLVTEEVMRLSIGFLILKQNNRRPDTVHTYMTHIGTHKVILRKPPELFFPYVWI